MQLARSVHVRVGNDHRPYPGGSSLETSLSLSADNERLVSRLRWTNNNLCCFYCTIVVLIEPSLGARPNRSGALKIKGARTQRRLEPLDLS